MNLNNDNIIIVIIINAIVKLNYIYSIILIKKIDYRKNDKTTLTK